MRKLYILFLMFQVIIMNNYGQQGNDINKELSLVPWPKDIKIKPEKTTIGANIIFVNSLDSNEIDQLLKTCRDDFSAIGFNVKISKKIPDQSDALCVYFFLNKVDNSPEGYRLTIEKNISIHANTLTGLFWGTRTLLQILKEGPDHLISKLEISDQPESEYRGLMIDAAREFHSVEFHLQMIKKLAYYKMNHYMIHFSDHQSYTLPSDIFPGLSTAGRHYSKEQIKLLVKTAKDYHINIVPSVDLPGHSEALIKGIPELKFDKELKRIDIAKEESYQILQNLIEEMMELFPGNYWHLGADEVSYPDKEDSPSEAYTSWMEKINVTKGNQLLNYFINRMYGFIKSRGYKMLVWEGFIPDVEPVVNREIIVCPFDIKYEGKTPLDYMNAGYKILNTSWSPLYVADKTSMTTPETLAMWTPNMFGAGRSPVAFRYWKKYNTKEISTEIIGAQMCSWANEEKAEWGLLFGEMPGYPEYGRPGPRVQIFSERTWTGGRTSAKTLLERTGASYW